MLASNAGPALPWSSRTAMFVLTLNITVRGCVSGGAGVQCTPVFQKWGCCTPVFWRTISTDFLNDRRMNNFGDNKYELPSMQQQDNRKVSIIAFVVSICPIFWCPRGGIWEGVYMTLAVAAYHWFLLHWSENLHPRFQIPNSPSVTDRRRS